MKLDGSEDHLGRGDVVRFWLELDTPSKRAQALEQIEEQWVTGALRWGNRRDVLHPFPVRGQLDEHVEGHEDERTFVYGCPWSDREEPSSDEEVTTAKGCVGGLSSSLTDVKAVAVGKVCECARQADDMLQIARGLGNAHVVAAHATPESGQEAT